MGNRQALQQKISTVGSAELKQVFKACAKNKPGFLNNEELENAIRIILGKAMSTLTAEETQKIAEEVLDEMTVPDSLMNYPTFVDGFLSYCATGNEQMDLTQSLMVQISSHSNDDSSAADHEEHYNRALGGAHSTSSADLSLLGLIVENYTEMLIADRGPFFIISTDVTEMIISDYLDERSRRSMAQLNKYFNSLVGELLSGARCELCRLRHREPVTFHTGKLNGQWTYAQIKDELGNNKYRKLAMAKVGRRMAAKNVGTKIAQVFATTGAVLGSSILGLPLIALGIGLAETGVGLYLAYLGGVLMYTAGSKTYESVGESLQSSQSKLRWDCCDKSGIDSLPCKKCNGDEVINGNFY